MFVTFITWRSDPDYGSAGKQITVNPHEVIDVEDYCGTIAPGQRITLKNKKTHLVAGAHATIVAALEAGRKDEKLEEKKLEREACFHKSQKQINLWVSPNMHGWRECNDEVDAKRLIIETGVQQGLRIE